jgi:hypothetical protein
VGDALQAGLIGAIMMMRLDPDQPGAQFLSAFNRPERLALASGAGAAIIDLKTRWCLKRNPQHAKQLAQAWFIHCAGWRGTARPTRVRYALAIHERWSPIWPLTAWR